VAVAFGDRQVPVPRPGHRRLRHLAGRHRIRWLRPPLFSVRNARIERIVSPHLVAATLALGPVPVGSTLMHDCDVRICVGTHAGHVRVATQGENMQQAVRRGRAAGPRPGLVDVRGNVGASRAIQEALRSQVTASPAELAELLAGVLAAGDPLRGIEGLFDLPPRAPALPAADFPVDLLDLAAHSASPTVHGVDVSVPLFDLAV